MLQIVALSTGNDRHQTNVLISHSAQILDSFPRLNFSDIAKHPVSNNQDCLYRYALLTSQNQPVDALPVDVYAQANIRVFTFLWFGINRYGYFLINVNTKKAKIFNFVLVDISCGGE